MKDEFESFKEKDKKISIAEAKSNFSEYISRVAYAGEKILITKRGKPVAAFVSCNDFDELKKVKKSDGLKNLIGKWKEFEGLPEQLDKIYKEREKDRGRDVSF
ncbi:MAG: type II toxin-antitoxin system Phd/YefM family antitoxin [Actinobacteria bacterium]|nr:type II toxin-antitoxin system Phd/YefM family antitoxin [Actinomycetota bacterium]